MSIYKPVLFFWKRKELELEGIFYILYWQLSVVYRQSNYYVSICSEKPHNWRIYFMLFTFHVDSWFKFDFGYDQKKISLNKNEYNKKQNKFIFEFYVNISQVVGCTLYLLLLIEEIRDFLVGY